MPRTFSLARLMIGVTLIGVVWGLIVNYPVQTAICALISTLVLPTVFVCLMLRRFSRQPTVLSIVSLFGGLVSGFLFVPPLSSPPIRTLWQAYGHVFVFAAIPAAIGALVLGGSVLLDEKFRHRNKFPELK